MRAAASRTPLSGKIAHTRVGQRLHRLLVPADVLGWGAPPCPAEIKVHRASDSWSLRVSCPGQTVEPLSAWMQSLGADALERDGTPDRLVLRASVRRIPGALEAALESCGVEHIALSLDGSATMMLRCGDDAVAHYLQRVGDPSRRAGALAPPITPRQAELLQYCVERGYYSIPRRAPLRRLARELGISTTSLSLALRRAEAKIILAYEAQLRAAGGRPAQPKAPADGKDGSGAKELVAPAAKPASRPKPRQRQARDD